MRPTKKVDTSESDDESNVRHDRFKSERFQDRRTQSFRQKEESFKHRDHYSISKRSDKTPPRQFKRFETTSSSSSYRSDSSREHSSYRSNYDREDRELCYRSKMSKSSRSEKPIHTKKYDEVNETEKSDSTKKNSNKLSSILKDFDRKLESKRSSENPLEGPALPPQLRQKLEDDKHSEDSIPVESPIGPALPSCLKNINENKESNNSSLENSMRDVGVALVSQLKNKINPSDESRGDKIDLETSKAEVKEEAQSVSQTNLENTSNNSSANVSNIDALPSEPDVYGPMLPPKLETDSYGPALPPNFKKESIKGPTLPSGMTTDQLELIVQEESEDEDMVGPLPEGKMNLTQYQLDLRAMHIKRKLEEEKSGPSQDIKKREEWMLELPPEKASNLGLGPRSFRMREAPDMSNRSGWTDTPADKLRKEEQALKGEVEPVSSEEMMRTAFLKEREEVMDKMSQLSRDEDRPNSLLEIHQKKLKKKKKKEDEEGKKKERRPFDRNIDLQVNRFDDAQKKAIFKKAQLLDTRFSTGETKYL